MKPRIAQIFPMILMLCLAIGTLWLERLVQLPPLKGKSNQRHDPDFIIEKLTIKQMNADGQPETSLSSTRMLHFPDDDSTLLENPRFVQHTADRPAVEIVGKRGIVNRNDDLVRIEENVRVTRDGYGGRPPMILETSALNLDPDTQIARTDEAVDIIEGASRIRGVGMTVNHKSRELELKSRVQVTLPAPSR